MSRATTTPATKLPPALATLKAQMLADKKKAGVLGVLLLVMLVLWFRTLGGKVPAVVSAAPAVTPIAAEPELPEVRLGSASVRRWLEGDIPPVSRNLFVVDNDHYRDPGLLAAADAPEPGEYWRRLERSMAMRAEGKRRQEERRGRIRQAADSLRLQATWQRTARDGTRDPVALISGRRVTVGQVVNGLRVARITPREVHLERDGVRLTLTIRRDQRHDRRHDQRRD